MHRNGHKSAIVWFTGLSGSGKSTIANLVEQELHGGGAHTYLLDGDNVRHGLNRDLGFTDADRVENIRRVGEVAKLFTEAGMIVLCSFISPFRAERSMVRELVAAGEFIEVFVDTPLAECIRRDPKGLYARANAGLIKNFTGIDSPYEPPQQPELRLDTTQVSLAECAARVVGLLRERQILAWGGGRPWRHSDLDLSRTLGAQRAASRRCRYGRHIGGVAVEESPGLLRPRARIVDTDPGRRRRCAVLARPAAPGSTAPCRASGCCKDPGRCRRGQCRAHGTAVPGPSLACRCR